MVADKTHMVNFKASDEDLKLIEELREHYKQDRSKVIRLCIRRYHDVVCGTTAQKLGIKPRGPVVFDIDDEGKRVVVKVETEKLNQVFEDMLVSQKQHDIYDMKIEQLEEAITAISKVADSLKPKNRGR